MVRTLTVNMPDIGEGVMEGELIQWLKNVGDSVSQDEPVVILMTDKATVELPAPQPGKLSKQYYKVGETAIKGKPLYELAVEGIEASPQKEEKTRPQPVSSPVLPKEAPPPSPTKGLATPRVRQMARELGVDLSTIPGTGSEGKVTQEDLKKRLSHTVEQPSIPHLPDDQIQPLQGIRRLTARQVALSKSTIPHFTYCDSADATQLLQLYAKLQKEGERENIRIALTALFARALSLTIRQFPQINASFDAAADALILHKRQQIGIAMKSPLGLIVPVLKGVEQLSFKEMMRSYDSLRQQALANQLKPSDMKEGTITLSNFGTEGGRWATPVIVAPQVAILATARIHPEPVVRAEQLVARPLLHCSWSFDHRVIDGDLAAASASAFNRYIENPLQLL